MTPAIDTGKGRFYPWGKDKYVSVTTILSEGLPKPQLNRWFIRTIAETAAAHRLKLSEFTEEEAKEWLLSYRSPTDGEAARLGSAIHAKIDKLANGLPIQEPTEEEAPYIKAFNAFVKKHKPTFIETESTVYSHKHGYAGTMDAMLEMDGNVYVVDTKTGKSVWPEAALQIAAYRYADFFGRSDGREDAIPPSSGGFVLHLRPAGYKIVPVDSGPEVFDSFLSALDIYRWVNFDSDYVIRKGHK